MKSKILNETIKILQDKAANEINIIDFERENPFTDYFVICEANSQRQIDAIVNSFVQLNKSDLISIRDIDGKSNSGWVALDLYEVVVHIFDKSTRKEYELDKLFFKYPQKLVVEDV